MDRNARRTWEARREKYEAPIIEAARKAGKLPVIDCTDKKYPVPPAVLRELNRVNDPDYREAAYREAVALRRKAASHRSLASVLERDAAEKQLKQGERQKKLAQAEALRQKATVHEQQADALDESVAPLN